MPARGLRPGNRSEDHPCMGLVLLGVTATCTQQLPVQAGTGTTILPNAWPKMGGSQTLQQKHNTQGHCPVPSRGCPANTPAFELKKSNYSKLAYIISYVTVKDEEKNERQGEQSPEQ